MEYRSIEDLVNSGYRNATLIASPNSSSTSVPATVPSWWSFNGKQISKITGYGDSHINITGTGGWYQEGSINVYEASPGSFFKKAYTEQGTVNNVEFFAYTWYGSSSTYSSSAYYDYYFTIYLFPNGNFMIRVPSSKPTGVSSNTCCFLPKGDGYDTRIDYSPFGGYISFYSETGDWGESCIVKNEYIQDIKPEQFYLLSFDKKTFYSLDEDNNLVEVFTSENPTSEQFINNGLKVKPSVDILSKYDNFFLYQYHIKNNKKFYPIPVVATPQPQIVTHSIIELPEGIKTLKKQIQYLGYESSSITRKIKIAFSFDRQKTWYTYSYASDKSWIPITDMNESRITMSSLQGIPLDAFESMITDNISVRHMLCEVGYSYLNQITLSFV